MRITYELLRLSALLLGGLMLLAVSMALLISTMTWGTMTGLRAMRWIEGINDGLLGNFIGLTVVLFMMSAPTLILDGCLRGLWQFALIPVATYYFPLP